MKCRDYRRAIAADPSGPPDDAPAHAAVCIACRRFRDEIRALDARIASALAIDVPPLRMPELPPVDATPSLNSVDVCTRPGRATLPAWIGLAASLVIAAFLGARFIAPDIAAPSLAGQVVAHMDHEQSSRRVTPVAVSGQALENVLRPDVSAIDTDALVTYARSCLINNNMVPHLVIQGKDGPVSLILMSDETIETAIPLSGQHVHGVIVPVGDGSVAIIGEHAEQLNEIEAIGQRLVRSVTWR